MADYVKARFHAARVGATMAILGLLAGLGIKSQGEQPPTTTVAFDPAATKSIANNAIGSVQIKNHSLLYKDLKLHQVPSYKEYKLFSSQIKNQFLKLDSTNLLHKVDSYLKLDVYNKAEADGAFLHKADTAQNALKIDDKFWVENGEKLERQAEYARDQRHQADAAHDGRRRRGAVDAGAHGSSGR